MDSNKIILIFEAHSDDCVIGMGGTAARFVEEDWRVVLVTVTAGETAYTTGDHKEKMVEIRQDESKSADAVLGISEQIFMGLPCQGVVNDRETYQRIVEIIREVRPQMLFTHQPGSKHRDHRRICKLVTEAWWKAWENVLADRGRPHKADKLFYFEVTDLFPKPTVIRDISSWFEKKIQALRRFESQLKVTPTLEQWVRGLAEARGAMAGFQYGEAFIASDFFWRTDF